MKMNDMIFKLRLSTVARTRILSCSLSVTIIYTIHSLSKSRKTSYFWGEQQLESSRAKRLNNLPMVCSLAYSSVIFLSANNFTNAHIIFPSCLN